MPGCQAEAGYRAPKSRKHLRDYWWFCLEHVREYNAAWDFYKGMTPGEIEAHMRADTSWQRPTWPLGRLGSNWDEELLKDPMHALRAGMIGQREKPASNKPPAELREPLATLGLSWPTTLAQVKSRYKELAKRHHPDANGGDRTAEERLKLINLAYAALKVRLRPETRMATAG